MFVLPLGAMLWMFRIEAGFLGLDARTNRGAVDIVFDVFNAVDLTYPINRAGEVPTLADDAAQRHLAGSNGNFETSTNAPFGRKHAQHGTRSSLDQLVGVGRIKKGPQDAIEAKDIAITRSH